MAFVTQQPKHNPSLADEARQHVCSPVYDSLAAHGYRQTIKSWLLKQRLLM